jgi:formate--tetrahydrofolate ligase
MITAASEVMAIFCLASDLQDLEARLGRIIVAYDRSLNPIRASDVNAQKAMTILLRDAMAPNLVQTLRGTPAFVHGGPFANIAHGCNSLMATKAGLQLGDVVVTEAGFGADLGAEKFFDIKCRFGGLEPAAAVVVATIRALKMHGGKAKDELGTEDVDAVNRGVVNLMGHVENVAKFGVTPVVAVNRFSADTAAEVQAVVSACEAAGVRVVESDPWGAGGPGCVDLADVVMEVVESGESAFKPLYPDEMPLAQKVETVATRIYGADGVDFDPAAKKDLDRLQEIGLGTAPVCIAKTQYSFSDDPTRLGRPSGFRVNVREVTPSAGAGFVVIKTGSIMTMPGLAARPAAENMDIDADGVISGLM